MALEGIRGIYTRCAYEYRTRVQPEGGTHKYRRYFPVYLIKPWVNQFVA